MVTNSIFAFEDKFTLPNVFGNWLYTSPKSLRIELVEVQVTDTEYIIKYEVIAENLQDQRVQVLLFGGGRADSFRASDTFYLATGPRVYSLRLTKFTRNSLTLKILTGAETFTLQATCDNVMQVSQAFSLVQPVEKMPATSATGGPGTRDITLEELGQLAPRAKPDNVKKHLAGINQACFDYEINTPLRKAHFLAQLLTESANLSATHEFGKQAQLDQKYHGFEGRGLIQLTNRENYTAYGLAVGEDFTTTLAARTKLENPPHAARSAGWFWASNGLSVWADTNDFIALTRHINGAYNGYSSRLAALRTILQQLAKMGYDPGISTNYHLPDSAVYGSARDTFAWGLWHDPGLARNNMKGRAPEAPRDAGEALIGYRRAVVLLEENERLAAKSTNLFGIQKMTEFASVRTTTAQGKPRVTLLDAARLRVQELAKTASQP